MPLFFRSNPQPGLSARGIGLTAGLAAAALLSGCGGADNGGLFVSSITATTAQFNRTMTINLSGSGLDKGVQVKVDQGCGDVTETAGGDTVSRRFSCKITALGDITIRAFTANNLEVARVRVTVPQPEVTFILTGLGATPTTTSSFVVRLDPEKAPISSVNFLDYVNAGFYRQVIFHRVVKDFVVQAGGYTAGPIIKAATQPAIKLESNNGLKNLKGTLAMARTAVPDSATSQFYINTVDNPSLDYKSEAEPGYAVFGSVITGLDVIEQLNAVPTRVDLFNGLTHLPVTNVVIISALQTK